MIILTVLICFTLNALLKPYNLFFLSREVVPRYRDTHLQVGEKYDIVCNINDLKIYNHDNHDYVVICFGLQY